MSKNFERQLLNLTPQSISFTPETVPIGQIIAHGSMGNDYALEKAMRQLAKQLPFKCSDWPSFTANVEDSIRVRILMGSIEISYVERGHGKPLSQGLSFTEAFFEVVRYYLSPKYSAEAQRHVESGINANVKSWLAQASRVKHMYEVNETYGRLTAVTCLEWMCQELIARQAFKTLAAAAKAETTLVHALRLGGLPEQMAREVYHEFMPVQVKKSVVTTESIIVSEAAFNSADPAAIVQSNVNFIAAQIDANMTADEISPEALQSYYVQYFLTHLNEGGFSRFVYHCGWDSTIVSTVRKGLQEMGASWHSQLFDRARKMLEQVGRKRLDYFLASKDFGDSDPIVKKTGALLSRYDGTFRAEEEINSLLTYNAEWLRQHSRLVVLSEGAIAQTFQERLQAKISRPTRLFRYGLKPAKNWRVQRLCRELCDVAGLSKGKNRFSDLRYKPPYHNYDGHTVCGWYFRADHRELYMLDLVERAVLFDTASNIAICEIDASEARFNPEPPVVKDLIPHFIEQIEKGDAVAIESARDLVQLHHIDSLVAYYNTQRDSEEGWQKKQLVIELVQDKGIIADEINEALRPIMLDFLRAPAGQSEAMDYTRSIALCVLLNQYGKANSFENNPTLLEETIASVLRENGL